MGKNQHTQLESEGKVSGATAARPSSDVNSVCRLHPLVSSIITHLYKSDCGVVENKKAHNTVFYRRSDK